MLPALYYTHLHSVIVVELECTSVASVLVGVVVTGEPVVVMDGKTRSRTDK